MTSLVKVTVAGHWDYDVDGILMGATREYLYSGPDKGRTAYTRYWIVDGDGTAVRDDPHPDACGLGQRTAAVRKAWADEVEYLIPAGNRDFGPRHAATYGQVERICPELLPFLGPEGWRKKRGGQEGRWRPAAVFTAYLKFAALREEQS